MANDLRTEPKDLDIEPHVLDVQRAYDNRQEQRMAEHLRVLYSVGGEAHEVRASISWESLAQLRAEMARAGQAVSDDDVLGFVLVPWAIDQAMRARQRDGSVGDDLTLDFGDAPRPPAVREMLLLYGLLA